MAGINPGMSSDESSLKDLYDEAMKLFDSIENSKEATNSDTMQLTIKSTISKFEKVTNLVSLSGMFSRNESLEELPTETLHYLLLPALLGTLTLKLTGQPRKEIINVAEIYFRDFLQRCKDYGVTDVEIPQPSADDTTVARPQPEQAKIAQMVYTREAKIKRYKEMQELKSKLKTLSDAMNSDRVDDVTKREYFTTLVLNYVNQVIDELNSIEQEKPILEFMEKRGPEARPRERPRPSLRPVVITRDAVQKAVFGAGYPALPTLTIEEFYDQRVRDGTFPAASNIPHATIQSTEENADEAEEIRKEKLIEDEDPEELAKQRNMDEFKDDHRRGWGNRYNRS